MSGWLAINRNPVVEMVRANLGIIVVILIIMFIQRVITYYIYPNVI